MVSIGEYFGAQHRASDHLFEKMEVAVSRDDWHKADSLLDELNVDILQHFLSEEEGLFPLFEEITGSRQGPTRVMRGEHAELRELLQRIATAVANRDREDTLGLAETFFLFLQQHNIKEEQVLYPMAEQALQGSLAALAARVPGFPVSD